MIMQYPNASANSLVETIRQAMEDSNDGIDWLVIAHNDARLVQSLNNALSEVSPFILETPQNDWAFGDGELAEAIAWAVEQPSIKHLAIVGHSRSLQEADSTTTQPFTPWQASANEANDGYARLRMGVTRTTSQTRDAQAKFAEQIEEMSAIDPVRVKTLDGELAVYGLFFMAESGSFLGYDPDRKNFLPLIP